MNYRKDCGLAQMLATGKENANLTTGRTLRSAGRVCLNVMAANSPQETRGPRPYYFA